MKNRMIKVMTWRAISIVITLGIMYAVTGDVKSATGITVLLHAILTVGHFVFESAWEKLGVVDGIK